MIPVEYILIDNDDVLIWCNVHQRRATHIATFPDNRQEAKFCCDPNLGGIMLPCDCINLTGIAVFVYTCDRCSKEWDDHHNEDHAFLLWKELNPEGISIEEQ